MSCLHPKGELDCEFCCESGICGNCNKKNILVSRRIYRLGGLAGTITSKSELCRVCYSAIGDILKGIKR